MASEIFFLAAALILLFFAGTAVGLTTVTVCAVVDRGFSWDLICIISPSIVARSASSPFKASWSSLCLSGMFASLECEREILARMVKVIGLLLTILLIKSSQW